MHQCITLLNFITWYLFQWDEKFQLSSILYMLAVGLELNKIVISVHVRPAFLVWIAVAR